MSRPQSSKARDDGAGKRVELEELNSSQLALAPILHGDYGDVSLAEHTLLRRFSSRMYFTECISQNAFHRMHFTECIPLTERHSISRGISQTEDDISQKVFITSASFLHQKMVCQKSRLGSYFSNRRDSVLQEHSSGRLFSLVNSSAGEPPFN